MKQINAEPKIEEIMAWAFHLYGERYVNAINSFDRCLQVDLEHYAEQSLKKHKEKHLKDKGN
jgi:hypothetical protein